MKKLIVLVLALLLISQIFPVFGQPESCCSHISVGAKNSNYHDCQVIGQGIRQCCPDMSLRSTTSYEYDFDSHTIKVPSGATEECDIVIQKKYRIRECKNCGALHSKNLISSSYTHHHIYCDM